MIRDILAAVVVAAFLAGLALEYFDVLSRG